MNYKEKIDQLKAIVLGSAKEEEVEEKVELAEDVQSEEEVSEPVPAEYVTLAQFNELKEDTKKFMESVTEMLSSAMEMINSTEKNTVPVEASKIEEIDVEEEVELSAEPVKHDPELQVKNTQIKVKLGAGGKETTADRAMKMWLDSFNK